MAVQVQGGPILQRLVGKVEPQFYAGLYHVEGFSQRDSSSSA